MKTKCGDCNSGLTYVDVLAGETKCAKCHSTNLVTEEEPLPSSGKAYNLELKAQKRVLTRTSSDRAMNHYEKTIPIIIQRSRAETYKYGYRFRARNAGGNYDYSFKELKELSNKGHNFLFKFNDEVPEEQVNYAIKKYADIGLDIVNLHSSVDEALEKDLEMYGVSYSIMENGIKKRLDPTRIVRTTR